MVAIAAAQGTIAKSEQPRVDPDGAIQVPAYSLPESSLLEAKTRQELKKRRAQEKDQFNTSDQCPSPGGADAEHMPGIRRCEAAIFAKTPLYGQLRDAYRVLSTKQEIGGVPTEVFVPAEGIGARNRGRVLINIHGGAFQIGEGTETQLESMPISSTGKFKVVSIDYRLAPEHVFPAASEDIAKVYRELLNTYKPANIGIYGCSAGGLLAAESIAWFVKEKLPLPGAVGMFCAGATYWTEGDSGPIGAASGWWPSQDTIGTNPYFKGVSSSDPLAFPARSAELLAKFPPSLLISGTRDVALSSVVYTHSLLVAQGVSAELHVWEGLRHAFFNDPDLPESREAIAVIVKFFDAHLGT
jgi:epsilon-lactone hydrolase